MNNKKVAIGLLKLAKELTATKVDKARFVDLRKKFEALGKPIKQIENVTNDLLSFFEDLEMDGKLEKELQIVLKEVKRFTGMADKLFDHYDGMERAVGDKEIERLITEVVSKD